MNEKKIYSDEEINIVAQRLVDDETDAEAQSKMIEIITSRRDLFPSVSGEESLRAIAKRYCVNK